MKNIHDAFCAASVRKAPNLFENNILKTLPRMKPQEIMMSIFKDLLNNNTMLKMKHMVDTASLKTKQAKNDYVWSKTRCPNDCSGNGNCTVVYSFELNANVGQCICSFGYGGVDCANEIDNRSPGDKLYDDILTLEKIGEYLPCTVLAYSTIRRQPLHTYIYTHTLYIYTYHTTYKLIKLQNKTY